MASEPKVQYAQLRMRQLDKSEYKAVKALMALYGLEDIREAFAVLIALGDEVHALPHGHTWMVNVISRYRSLTEKDRVYGLTSTE